MATSIYVIAAMCGCWYRESGVNPGIWESLTPCAWDYQYEYTGKGGYGLGQWTNVGTSHGRLYRLHQWVTSNGYTDGEGNGQLAYLTVEGCWNGSYNGTGDNSQTRGSYGSLSNFLNSTSTNLDNLVWDFLANWEGVPGDNYSIRRQWAYNILSYLQEHAGESATWTSRNNYITETQTYQNALCVYNFFSGYTPEPEPDTYRITVQVRGNGVAYASSSYAKEGDTITLTAEPSGSAEFEGWQVVSGGITITNNSFVMPANTVVIRAIFTGTTVEGHTITLIIKGKGKCTIEPEDDSYAVGTAITLNPVPLSKFIRYIVTEGTIEIDENSFTMPDSDVTIIVVFKDSFIFTSIPWWRKYGL